MNIEDYFSELNVASQEIFAKTVESRGELGKTHHASSCLFEFAENISDPAEREILQTVSSQLESATLSVTLGMYRQAFASLRLALELGLAAVHFSVHKLEFCEWITGERDIKWQTLINAKIGVFSPRFTKAFFPVSAKDAITYREKAAHVYRQLSEFVHGNRETWNSCGIKLEFKQEMLDSYFKTFLIVADVVLFGLSCRYLQSFPKAVVESLQFIPEEMSHVSCIREYFGGPKEQS